MSNPEEVHNAEPKMIKHTANVQTRPEVIPSEFSTVHVDKAMVAIDNGADTATVTLLSQHVIPKIGSEGWTLDNIRWKVIGELKIPLPVMNALVVYYAQEVSNGLNILPLIQKHLKEHPPEKLAGGISYGPTDIRSA